MNSNIMTLHINIKESFSVTGKDKNINMVMFDGYVESDFCRGQILPGGVDTQTTTAAGTFLSARYMVEGNDCTGASFRMFIENTMAPGSDVTNPVITTDSAALSWLEHAVLEGRLHFDESGLSIEIHEKTCSFTVQEYCLKPEGRNIYGELYTPDDETSDSLVIMSHGYNCTSESMKPDAERLASLGIYVYAYDFCGGGRGSKSSGKSTEMSILTEQRDLLNVVSHFRNLTNKRIYLYGASQGGFITALTAPEINDDIKEIFLLFPAFCIPDDWNDKRGYSGGDFDFWGLTLGKAFTEGLPDYDVFEHSAEYKGKVILFHGVHDSVVNISYSEKAASKYENAILFEYPGQGHGFDGRFCDLTARIVADEIKNR